MAFNQGTSKDEVKVKVFNNQPADSNQISLGGHAGAGSFPN